MCALGTSFQLKGIVSTRTIYVFSRSENCKLDWFGLQYRGMNMKKRAAHSSSASLARLRIKFGSRFLIAIFALLCFCSMFGLHQFTNRLQGTPKIAFMFLVRENLPLDFLWHSFFKVHISTSTCVCMQLHIYMLLLLLLDQYIIVVMLMGFDDLAECRCCKVFNLYTFQAWFCV